MKLAYPFNVVRTSSLPRRLSIACAAAFLVLGGCSTYADVVKESKVERVFADKEDLRRAIMLAAAYEIIERLLA